MLAHTPTLQSFARGLGGLIFRDPAVSIQMTLTGCWVLSGWHTYIQEPRDASRRGSFTVTPSDILGECVSCPVTSGFCAIRGPPPGDTARVPQATAAAFALRLPLLRDQQTRRQHQPGRGQEAAAATATHSAREEDVTFGVHLGPLHAPCSALLVDGQAREPLPRRARSPEAKSHGRKAAEASGVLSEGAVLPQLGNVQQHRGCRQPRLPTPQL